jgi:hypothetical protein
MATSKLLGTTTIKLNDVSTTKFRDVITASAWASTGGTTFNLSVNYISDFSFCPSDENAWLTANYPPSNYSIGYIIRVRSFTNELVFCGESYWVAV